MKKFTPKPETSEFLNTNIKASISSAFSLLLIKGAFNLSLTVLVRY